MPSSRPGGGRIVDAVSDEQGSLRVERKEPPRLFALLDEQVLHRDIGGPAVMAAQLAALAHAARRPRTTIQVIPSSRPHFGLMGAFVVAELPQPPAIVYLAGPVDGLTLEEPAAAEAHTALFDMLRGEALGSGDSLRLIEEVAQQWQHRNGNTRITS